ncbi:MAG: hypothetical protein HY692_06015 [Cyanobacteria bacterium NC_groundwater_1444_Ag_S-0.65um_54_12]|nr:hypothetical protein [Cyanobacteria bacterium NC_groundwater_1444_Ag_S-0.65um_54_12]
MNLVRLITTTLAVMVTLASAAFSAAGQIIPDQPVVPAAAPSPAASLSPATVPAAAPSSSASPSLATVPAAAPSPSPYFAMLLPAFDYTAIFSASGGKDILYAEETGHLRLELRNLENRSIRNVTVSYHALNPVPGIAASGSVRILEMLPSATRTVDLLLPAKRDLTSGLVDYIVEVAAEDGAYGPPTRVSFHTKALSPLLKPLVPDQIEILTNSSPSAEQ